MKRAGGPLPVEENSKDKDAKVRGQVRVAKYYPKRGMPAAPDGYRNILIHSSGKTLGAALSPYKLKDEQGRLIENVWQFAKVYQKVDAQKTPMSWRFKLNTIIWEHPAEVHVDEEGNLTPEYWAWRDKGMKHWYAVRYPNGFQGRHKCLYAYWDGEKLGYIESRKKIYCGEYIRLAPTHPDFIKLKALLDEGQNIQIVEVDGPDPTLTYAPYDRISRDDPGLPIDEQTIRTLIDDERKPFGHGYVIAALLLDGADWLK